MNAYDELSTRQLKTIAHLLAAPSIEEACRRARVSKATVYGWLKDENFRDELRRRRGEVFEKAFDSLRANVTKAMHTLTNLLDSEKETIRLKAAERIIAIAQRSMKVVGNERSLPSRPPSPDDLFTKDQQEQLKIAQERRLALRSPQ